jgi:hypothetical protein
MENKMSKLTLNELQYDLIQKASEALDKSSEKENWSLSNEKLGYLTGLVDCSNSKKLETKRKLQYAKWCFDWEKKDFDYGKMAYWKSFIDGFTAMMVAVEEYDKIQFDCTRR